MRRLIVAAAALAALAGAGIAVARGLDGTTGAVRATFTATSAAVTDTRTCKNAAGRTIASSRATFTGTASGSPDLTGPVTISARSTIDTSAGVGVVTGTFEVAKAEARFTAVYDHGSIVGTASGHATPHTQLVGVLSAGYSAAGGFTGGKIGGGAAGGSAVELAGEGCGEAPAPPPRQSAAKTAEGAITAVSAASITVGKLTCDVPPTPLRITVAFGYSVGERVKITCNDSGGTLTLVTIEKRG